MTEQSRKIAEWYEGTSEVLSQTLETATQVVDMDNFKFDLVLQLDRINDDLARQKACLHFLFSENDLPSICAEPVEENGKPVSGLCLYFARASLKWPSALQK